MEDQAGPSLRKRYEEIKGLKPARAGSFLGEEGEKFYVAKSEEEVYELSALAYYVWLMCNGETTVEQMAAAISRDVEASVDDVIDPLVATLESLKEAGLVVY